MALEKRGNLVTKDLKLEYWGPGEWVDEPDIFRFEHSGFSCLAHRVCAWDGLNRDHLALGHWCGYVMIPEGHPWHGVDFFKSESPDVDVHGGITFCEVDVEGQFAIGFDCAHSMDIVPSMAELKKKMKAEFKERWKGFSHFDIENNRILRDSYKNLDFVIQEIKSLAEQAKKAASDSPSPDSP